MADTQIIAANLTVNTEEAVKNYLKLKGAVADLKKEFNNAKAGSDEQIAALKKLKGAEEDLAKANKQLNESNKETTGHFAKIKAGISELPGATGAAGKGVQSLSAQFKALLANPIVLIIAAIVTALTLLYKAFTSTGAGADKMEQIFSGLGAVIDVIRDRVLKVAGAIAKFFSGDFKGALQDARTAVSGIGDEIAAEFQKAADATAKLQEVEDAMRDLGVSRAKLNRDLARTKEIITDENATFAEKKKAIDEVRAAEGKQTEQELANAKKKLEAIKALNDQSRENLTDEKLQEEADALAAVYALEEKSASDIRSLNKQSRAIEKQEAAKAAEEARKAAEVAKAERQKLVEFTNKLTKLQQDNELALLKDSYEKELKALENRIADEKRQNQLAFQDRKITKDQQAQLDAALDIQAILQRDAIEDKRKKDLATKEAAFQKELSDITSKTRITGIKDAQQSELVQLEIGYQEKLKLAIEKYKDDATKLAQIQTAIDEQYRIEKAAKEAKFKEEEDKKKLETDIAAQEKLFNDQASTLEIKKAAIDQEQILIQTAFDNKRITEEEYNKQIESLSEKRKKIVDIETDHRVKTFQIIGNATNAFADLIGKNTVAGKIAAIAATTINTYEAAWSIFKNASKNPASIPFPAYPYIQAGLAIAAGLKTVNDIVKVKTPGGGGGGTAPSASSPVTPAAPIAPTQTSTSLDANTINAVGNAAAGGVNSVRAYVVEQDNAAAANRAARLAGAAVLGG